MITALVRVGILVIILESHPSGPCGENHVVVLGRQAKLHQRPDDMRLHIRVVVVDVLREHFEEGRLHLFSSRLTC